MMLGTVGLFASLSVLALIDATSIGTLVIPLWLVLRARKRGDLRAAVLYLCVIGAFYLAIGLALLRGVHFLEVVITGSLAQSPVIRWIMLVLGGVMLIWAICKNPRKQDQGVQGIMAPTSGRVASSGSTLASEPHGSAATEFPKAEGRWARRIDTALGSTWGIVGLGITAGLLELPTMLPYLGAMGLLAQSSYGLAAQAGLLTAYCLVMLIPGFLAIGVRAAVGERLQGPLDRLSSWLTRASGETLLWVVGIVGFLMARSSLGFLFPAAAWNPFK
ncbi:MAG: GAP family protein [Paeniglutamicibacter terrestris]